MRGWGRYLAPVIALWGVAFAHDRFHDWVAATNLPPLIAETSVEVRDRNGILLRAYAVEDGLMRLGAAPQSVDQRYLDMLVAYEDKRFFQHNGVDPLALTRAVVQAVMNQEVVSGGSTLTMQVARLLEDGSTGRWSGKLRQMRVALALETRLNKEQILSLYLTHAPYGGNLEGIRAATLAWFGKEPRRLTPAQAALLIALPQSPEGRRPDRDRQVAQAARDRVLDRLAGSDILTTDDVRAAKTETISAKRRPFPTLAAHMADRAVDSDPLAHRHNLTLDSDLQLSLEALAKKSLFGLGERLSIAMLVANHETGEVLASVGSAGYAGQDRREGFVDMTRAVRSPGSTLKPLVYAMGFDDGLVHPETLIDDRPVTFGGYAPQNFDGRFRGELKIAEALRQSLNIPVVLLADQLGPARIMSAIRKSGATPKLPLGKAGLAVVLGGIGVTMEDLVRIYAMQARGGASVDLVWRMGSDTAPERHVISRSAAWQVGHVLSSIAPPAGAPLNRLAYKTGTSYGHRDAWALGYDGQHVIGVWIGRADGTPVPGAFGGELAAPVLFEAFQRLKPTLDPLGPPPPETLTESSAQLPQPLQRFRGREAVFEPASDTPIVAFPPNGARLAQLDGGLTVKIREGVLPLTILANGRPLATRQHRRDIDLDFAEKGASTLTVIDDNGRSDRITIWID
ncbi:penicillin-binding protein 1C [uncultured Shimia sp.]|uniref:penicillin-binding protein 1C n=1 Tax=uncultured Shimia sp. TaxID=573152 RepID=UPI002611F1C1|nr:penicillin-binding protein 1C [uncultured Shimia sp.]